MLLVQKETLPPKKKKNHKIKNKKNWTVNLFCFPYLDSVLTLHTKLAMMGGGTVYLQSSYLFHHFKPFCYSFCHLCIFHDPLLTEVPYFSNHIFQVLHSDHWHSYFCSVATEHHFLLKGVVLFLTAMKIFCIAIIFTEGKNWLRCMKYLAGVIQLVQDGMITFNVCELPLSMGKEKIYDDDLESC